MKRLDSASIANELENSSFFPTKKAPAPTAAPVSAPRPQPKAELLEPPLPVNLPLATPKPVTETPRPVPVPAAAPSGRTYVRRTFDIFDDQLAYLRRVSLEDQLAGGEGSMNAMVREALDAFI